MCIRDSTQINIVHLVIHNGRCCGALGFDERDELVYFRAKAVFLGTGGASAIYKYSLATPDQTGDGYIMALDAGAELMNIEFIQFIPGLTWPVKKFLFQEKPLDTFPVIQNRDGEDVLAPYLPANVTREACLLERAKHAPYLCLIHIYPKVKVILAHVGRAYCANDLGDSLRILSNESELMFDFTANCNAYVLTELIKAVGPKRVMFGSDLPILRMRMRRIEENGRYVNLVPPGLYGDVSNDPHMRETPGEDFTFFMYREIEAMRTAALATGLNQAEIEDIFYTNAARLLQLEPAGHCK